MHYLVTGGAGFIGTNIVEALLARGDKVRILDDFSTGKRERVPARSGFAAGDAGGPARSGFAAGDAGGPAGAELIEGTITDLATCRRACEGVDGVFHTAALARMTRSIADPIGTSDVNVGGTLNMLVAARDAGVKRFVFSGSSSVYGVQDALPLKEDMKPRPSTPYALQKLAGEEYCRLFWEFYQFPTVTLRYFSVYGGKHQITDGAYALVFGIFIRQKRAGEPLTLCGNGEYARDFTHIDDVVRANLLAMDKDTVGHGEVINIGAGDNHTVKELAALFGGETVFIPPRQGDARDSLADRTRARELLGWEPTVSFEDGVRGTLKVMGLDVGGESVLGLRSTTLNVIPNDSNYMNIGIIGLGMVGGAIRHGFAKIGHQVKGYDVKFPETSLRDVLDTELVFVCVPTPNSTEGSCDISIVRSVVQQLAEARYAGLVAIKSTITPGTTDQLARTFAPLRLACCPEFLREKASYTDFVENHDLCVIGAYDEQSFELIKKAHGELPQHVAWMTPLEAELIKYFVNVYNAYRIIFANEFYEVCKTLGADYMKIKNAVVHRRNVGNAYLDCNENFRGFGGSCLPKDAQAFATFVKQRGINMKIFETLVEENKKFKTTIL